MQTIELTLDGIAHDLSPRARREGESAWVPLDAFCDAVGAVSKQVEGSLAVCDVEGGDVCVLLPSGEVRHVDGVAFARLDAFAEALGLSAFVSDGVLAVRRHAVDAAVGLAIGDRPPPFTLPEVGSGALVSSDVVLGKPAIFYMWASW